METEHSEVERVDPIDEVRWVAENPGSAIRVDWSFHRYLSASDFVSRSALEDLRTKGPAYYKARYIDRTIPFAESAAMQLGTLLHMRLLEPEKWAREVLVWDELPRPAGANGRAKQGTEPRRLYDIWKMNSDAWADERDKALSVGATVIDLGQAEKIEAMAASVLRHPFGSKLFGPTGENETTILWHHADTGALIRVRLDRVFPLRSARLIVDLKTTKDPSPDAFAKSIVNFGYHTQGALYVDAARALEPEADFRYVIVAVRNEAPYECAVYELAEANDDGEPGPLARGREHYTEALHDFMSRRETDVWVAPWQTGITKIELPGWAKRK